MTKKIFHLLTAFALGGLALLLFKKTDDTIPVIGIANYGPHASLEDSITGFKKKMVDLGYVENENIQYMIVDVGFDTSLIPQTISRLKMARPQVIVTMATPIAQYAKETIKDIPLVYSVVTEPVDAGLLESENTSTHNMTGSSDRQDLDSFLEFAQAFFPESKTIGLLYSNAENNDHALVNMLKNAAERRGMQVLAIAVNQSRDIPVAMQNFKGQVDFIYVGSSGVIQPALPLISAEARHYGIPIFNFDAKAVYEGLALASFGVDYEKVGANAAQLVAAILGGQPVSSLMPTYPKREDHFGVVDPEQLTRLGVSRDLALANTTYIGGMYAKNN